MTTHISEAPVVDRITAIEQRLSGLGYEDLCDNLRSVRDSIASLGDQDAREFEPLVDQLAAEVEQLPMSATCAACAKTVSIHLDDPDAILVAGYWEDSDGAQYCGDCPADAEDATCGWNGCDAVADHDMVLSADSGPLIDRPICRQHLAYELPVHKGWTLTITGRGQR